jgi:hypothetical protein
VVGCVLDIGDVYVRQIPHTIGGPHARLPSSGIQKKVFFINDVEQTIISLELVVTYAFYFMLNWYLCSFCMIFS